MKRQYNPNNRAQRMMERDAKRAALPTLPINYDSDNDLGNDFEVDNNLEDQERKNILGNIFKPLVDTNKITPSRNYNKFLNIETGKSTPVVDLQLANFLSKALAKERKFNNINFSTKKAASLYKPQERNIEFNQLNSFETDPVKVFNHEAIHALDHKDRTDLKTAIPWLAEKERKYNTSLLDNPDWYNESQNLIDNDSFINEYPYYPTPRDNIYQGMAQIDANGNPINYDEANPQGVDNFSDLQGRLAKSSKPKDTFFKYMNTKGELQKSPYYMTPFSEIRSFAFENLNDKYPITDTNWKDYPQGRPFLKTILKSTYNDFLRRDPNFSTNYPAAYTAFRDRIGELRNRTTYNSPSEYLSHFDERQRLGYNPNKQPLTRSPYPSSMSNSSRSRSTTPSYYSPEPRGRSITPTYYPSSMSNSPRTNSLSPPPLPDWWFGTHKKPANIIPGNVYNPSSSSSASYEDIPPLSNISWLTEEENAWARSPKPWISPDEKPYSTSTSGVMRGPAIPLKEYELVNKDSDSEGYASDRY